MERKIIYSYKKGKVQLKKTTATQITQIKQKPFLSKVTPDQNGIFGEGGKPLVMTSISPSNPVGASQPSGQKLFGWLDVTQHDEEG